MPEEVLTEELLNELISKPKVDCVASSKKFKDTDFQTCLNSLASKYKLQKKDIIHASNLNSTHVYQMFQGTRNASRDKVLQLAFAMKLNLKDTDHLLHSAGVSTLYCKNRRDAIIIYCLEHKYSLMSTEEVLYKFNEDTLA